MTPDVPTPDVKNGATEKNDRKRKRQKCRLGKWPRDGYKNDSKDREEYQERCAHGLRFHGLGIMRFFYLRRNVRFLSTFSVSSDFDDLHKTEEGSKPQ